MKIRMGILLVSVLVTAGSLGELAAIALLPDALAAIDGGSDTPSQTKYDELKKCVKDTAKETDWKEYLTNFNCGHVTTFQNGTVLREFTLIVEENQTISISQMGHKADAWTFNGTVPGPTMRFTEGDHVRITVVNSNSSKHAHSLHMHSVHSSMMDGVDSPIAPGSNFTYDFIAQPYGVYPYHCHVDPIADHINRGLYGMIIIDPKTPREEMPEMVMLMNGYDLDYDAEGMITIRPVNATEDPNEERDNEIYSVNGMAFGYTDSPIQVETGKKYRIYLENMLEFDLINSFHVHGALFDYYPSGTEKKLDYQNDIVTMSQGDRGILELEFKYAGDYMFHAHQAEFTDKGWMGFFHVVDDSTRPIQVSEITHAGDNARMSSMDH